MGTTSEELKRLYSNLGGDDKDTAKTQSPVEVLKKIYEYLGGENPNAKNVQQTGDILNKFNEMDIKLCVDERFYPPIIDEVKGNPVTFSGSEAPLVRCDIDLKPQQDLHGYDKPWVGGAGKNLLQVTTTTTQTVSGVTFTVNDDGTINTSGTATARIAFPLATNSAETPILNKNVIMNGCPSNGSLSTYFLQWYGYDGASASENDIGNGTNAFTPTSTAGSIAIVIQSGINVDNLVFKPMARLATVTDPTFASYSNICPISGYSSVGVNVAGKNLFDKTTYTFTSEKYVSLSTGNIGTNSSYACTESYIPCGNLAGQTITLNHIPGGNQPGMAFYDSNNDYISGGKGDAITVPSNAVSYRFTVPIEYASGNNVQIELGSTASEYVPYNPNSHTYTISLGDTYYSGQIDVVKGVLVADKAEFICDGTESGWSKSTTTACDVYMAALPFSDFNFNNVYMTDKFAYTPERNYNTVGYTWRGSSNKQLRVGFADYNTSTVASFKTWLGNNPLQIVADLETPLEIPLTPTEIFALQGINTMWTNADSLDVEYITDNWNIFHPTIETESTTKRMSTKSTKPTRNLVLRVPIEDIEPTEEAVEVKEDISEPTKEEPIVKKSVEEVEVKEDIPVKKSVEENPVKEDTTDEEVVTDEQQSV